MTKKKKKGKFNARYEIPLFYSFYKNNPNLSYISVLKKLFCTCLIRHLIMVASAQSCRRVRLVCCGQILEDVQFYIEPQVTSGMAVKIF